MSEKQNGGQNDRPEEKTLFERMKAWFRAAEAEIDKADAEIDRRRKELEAKNARGTRRTDGRI